MKQAERKAVVAKAISDAEGERGPAYMKLSPRHKILVDAYILTGNRTEAYRMAGYAWSEEAHKASPSRRGIRGANARRRAHLAFLRDDIKAAVLEETQRELTIDLPAVVGRIRKLSSGDPVSEGKAPPSAGDALRAGMFLAAGGGLHPVQEIRQTVTVKTDLEKLKELRRLVEQKVIPAALIEGLTLSEAEYEEIGGEEKPEC